MGESNASVNADEIDYNDPPFPLTAIDRELLATRDEDFHRITWADLTAIIASNTLEHLKRTPSDLRRYLVWSHTTKRQHGSITAFVIRERLHWTPLSSSSSSSPPQFPHRSPIPFSSPSDYAILLNDWPYGFAPRITHLLVWSKTPIATDEVRGDVTDASRRTIEQFVERQFVRVLADHEGCGEGCGDVEQARTRVLWFKNWVSLQSVRGVDHVHVLVRDAPGEVLRKWTERNDLYGKRE